MKRGDHPSTHIANPAEAIHPQEEVYQLVDPEDLTITVSDSSVQPSDFSPSFRLPSFDIQATGNDYVKILRCQESYRPYLEYMLSEAEQQRGSHRESRKWVWLDSLGNN